MVNVIAWQAFAPSNGRRVAEFYEADYGGKPDAISFGPYFGVDLGVDRNAADVKQWSLNKLFDHLDPDTPSRLASGVEEGNLKESFDAIEDYAEIADDFNSLLLAYEGGQHLVGVSSNSDDPDLISLFTSANRDVRMKDIYRKYLNKWREVDADVFSHFSSVSFFDKNGSWGAKEFGYLTREQSPKYDAILTFLEQNPVTWERGNLIWGNQGSADDLDNDGVLNAVDQCPNTPAGAVVNLDGCEVFSLPANNFQLVTYGESCMVSNNGKIEIATTNLLDYTASLTDAGGNESSLDFTDNVQFENLASGAYQVCITVANQPAYNQCFDINNY